MVIFNLFIPEIENFIQLNNKIRRNLTLKANPNSMSDTILKSVGYIFK